MNGGNISYVGSFNTEEGIFKSHNAIYFFDIGTSFSLKKTKSASLVSINESNINSAYKKIDYNGNSYVLFSGVYVPFTQGSDELHGSVNVGAINSSVTTVNVSFNSTYQMWLRV